MDFAARLAATQRAVDAVRAEREASRSRSRSAGARAPPRALPVDDGDAQRTTTAAARPALPPLPIAGGGVGGRRWSWAEWGVADSVRAGSGFVSARTAGSTSSASVSSAAEAACRRLDALDARLASHGAAAAAATATPTLHLRPPQPRHHRRHPAAAPPPQSAPAPSESVPSAPAADADADSALLAAQLLNSASLREAASAPARAAALAGAGSAAWDLDDALAPSRRDPRRPSVLAALGIGVGVAAGSDGDGAAAAAANDASGATADADDGALDPHRTTRLSHREAPPQPRATAQDAYLYPAQPKPGATSRRGSVVSGAGGVVDGARRPPWRPVGGPPPC